MVHLGPTNLLDRGGAWEQWEQGCFKNEIAKYLEDARLLQSNSTFVQSPRADLVASVAHPGVG